jgi:Golgi phosphoprotein 3
LLTLLEEIVLLTINPRTGCLEGGNNFGARYALAGAVLFDLALAHRIDTDVDTVFVINDTPTGNLIQDDLLAALAKGAASCKVRDCVEQIFFQRQDLEGEALALLIEKGILRKEASKFLWVIDLERLRVLDDAHHQYITARLAQAVLGDEIPDVRDIMLVSIANACGLLSVVLAPGQIEKRAEWIETLSKIETISRNVSTSIAALMQDLARGTAGFGIARSV